MKPDIIIHMEINERPTMQAGERGRRYSVEPGWWISYKGGTPAFCDAATWSFHPRREAALFQSNRCGQVRYDWTDVEITALTLDGDRYRAVTVDRPTEEQSTRPETVQERARRGDRDAVARMKLAGQLDYTYLTEAGLDHLALPDRPLPTGDGPVAKKYTFPLSVTVERTDGPPVDEADVLSALKEEIEQLEFDCGDESSVFTVDTAASA